VAKSKENPNLFGKAIVDSMEGVKQEVQAVLGPEAWRPGANPNPAANGVGRPDSLWTSLSDEQLRLRDINPNVSSERENDKIRVMDLPFSLGTRPGGPPGPETVSLVQPLSRAGLDFSKKVSLELWVEGAGAAGAGMDFCVGAGQFNEDADNDGLLDTEDRNLDGGLNFGEDTGWGFDNPGNNGIRTGDVTVGAGDERLDSEDLDGDGVLRTSDLPTPRGSRPFFCLSPANYSPSSNANTQEVRMINSQTGTEDRHTDLNFTGWRLISVPLNISSSEETEFQAIKQVRLTLRNGSASSNSGSLRLAKVAFVGTSWEKPVASVSGSTMTLAAVNNVDNPEYNSLLGNPAYDDLYKDEATSRTREQALSLRYDLAPGSTATTREVYEVARDFSKHRNLQFFLQIPSTATAGGFFALQLGSETDYYEYRVPLDARYIGTWVLETLQLVDINSDGTPDIIKPLNSQGQFRVVGSPSFQRIGQLKLVVFNDQGSPLTSELWINEIHLTGSVKKEGNAQRFAADLSWPEWGTLGGRIRQVDRDFQTLTAQVLNQDRNESAANFSLTRMRWLPLSGNINKSETITPAVFRTGDAALVSLLSEGRETTVTGRGDGQLLIPRMPAVGFSYDKALSVSTTRGERRDRDTYTGSADYQLPWAPDVLPGGRLTLRPLPQSLFVKYSHTNNFFTAFNSTATLSSQEQAFNQSRTVEFTDEWSGRAPFSPWNGLSFQPSVAFKKVREERRFSEDTLSLAPEFASAKSYPKAAGQTYGFSGSWRVLRWLEPRFDGELSGTETNNLPTASSPTAFNAKLIERSAKTNLFWTFRAADMLPNFRPTQSFRLESSYQLDSGDAYENVAQGFSGWRDMKPFSFKKVERRNGRRMYGLLEPLDVGPAGGRRKQLTSRNSLRSSLDWTPFDWLMLRGPAEPLRTFRLTTTYTDTEEHTEAGEAIRDVSSVVFPDVLLSIRDTERFMRLERWMSNSQLNVRGNRKRTETFGQEFRLDNAAGSDYHFVLKDKYDVFLSYSITNGFSRSEQTGLLTAKSDGYNHSVQVGTRLGSWQVTPRGDFRSDKSVDGAGRVTQDAQSQAYSVLLRLDRAYPRGFRIPFTRKIFENVNRLIIDGKIGYERKSSGIDVDRNNTDNYTADMSGEWEISRNFRFSFGGGLSMVNNRVRKDDGVMSYNLTSQLVINF
jgi:hypothetical protein